MASVSTAKTGEPVRIFFICQRVPFPPDRGDKIATFNEIRHLATAHEVHVFCLGDGARDLDNIPGLRDLCNERHRGSAGSDGLAGCALSAR